MALSRDEPILQSAEDLVRSTLDGLGYNGRYRLVEASPDDTDSNPLDVTHVVFSLADRETPEDGEIGGPLSISRVTIMIDVLGSSERMGSNIASQIWQVFADDKRLPLYDYSTSTPLLADKLQVANVLKHRLYFNDPKPWQAHWHTVTVAVEDVFNRAVS